MRRTTLHQEPELDSVGSSLTKIILGAILATGLWLTTPMLGHIQLFIVCTAVPLAFLYGVSLAFEGFIGLFRRRQTIAVDLNTQISSWRDLFNSMDQDDIPTEYGAVRGA